ncbi:TonB-dependent receptor plug domain-containing protein [Steroidobacter cummioxidans]|uniref:TonB-dependent receptor plug domain-containing protein n=1 Tax=Steroidobacter cummioxidans TaxID=1803913 RepID=UPI000E30CBDD|nr:TonB-dependent receptor [Steroidobacter cummioxidans]
MRDRHPLVTSRRIRGGFVACIPFAAALAAEPPPTNEPEEPPIGGAPIAATPANLGAGVIRYEASFFAEFQPTTALDIVRRVPGFTFQPGDTTVRGFAGALGNVLIDGQRPASKAVLLEDVLRRIPISAVTAIEVIRGGAPGINMQGQSVVANVIRRSGNMSTLAGELTGLFATEHEPGVGLRLESASNIDRLTLNGTLNFRDEQQYGSSGKGELTRRDANRELYLSSGFETDWRQRQYQANGQAEYQGDAGLLRINLGGTSSDTKQYDILTPRSGVPQTFDWHITTDIKLDQGEAGVDYEHTLSDALSARALLLQTLERKIISADSIDTLNLQRSEDEALRGESILRSSATYRASSAVTIETGLEGAYNFLDVDARLSRNGTPVPLPAAKVKIEERRGEAFVDFRWKATPRLASDFGMRYEMSTISQSGDHDAKRTLSYAKPRVMVRFDMNSDIQLRGRVERTVSQLEFRDFASQASLDAGIINGGNANLKPENAWEFEGTIETRFWGAGALLLSYMHSLVSDVVDLVPVGDFDAPGNLGDGTRDKISLGLSLPMERLGLSGTQVRLNSDWSWSQVEDPVTFESRRITKHSPLGGNLLITKEFPALNSTLSLEDSYSKRETYFRIGEVRTEHWDHFFRLYWDWTPRSDTVIRMMVNNFTGRPRSRWRTVYDGSRASGQILYHEDRHIDAQRFIQLQIRKTF